MSSKTGLNSKNKTTGTLNKGTVGLLIKSAQWRAQKFF